MEGSSLPSPKFSSPNEGASQDFLGFSSTPIPGKNFKPKWGKKNRNQNWNRFGNFNDGNSPGQEPSQAASQNHQNSPHLNNQYQNSPHHANQHHQNSPHHANQHHQNSPHHANQHHQNSPHHRGHFHTRGSPRQYTPSPRGRGSFQNTQNGGRGSYQNSPNGGRGSYQNNFGGGRGSFNNSPNRGRGGFQNSPNAGGGYFSPAMLRNPWADLEWARDRKRETSVEDKEEETVTGVEGNVEESEENNEDDGSNNVMSDSMIPQVGESLLERNNDITSVDDDLVTADDGGEKADRNNAEDI